MMEFILVIGFVYFVASVLAFVAGTACAYIDDWQRPSESFRYAFAAAYLMATALVTILTAATFVDSIIGRHGR